METILHVLSGILITFMFGSCIYVVVSEKPMERNVICETFETGWHKWSYMDDGVIMWGDDPYTYKRKMPESETCYTSTREVKDK